MKVTFLSAGYELLSIEYLSSYLKEAGHETSLAFDPLLFSDSFNRPEYLPLLTRIFNFTPRVIKTAISQEPELIAISTVTPFYRWALNVSQRIKKNIDVPVIIGGIHASAVPERILKNKCIDMVCIGEGEKALLDIVTAIEKDDYVSLKKIPNIWYRDKEGKIHKNKPRPLIQDLDSLPFPDKNLFYEKSKVFRKRYLAITSRGCIFNCSFCQNNVWRNIYCNISKWNIRRRSVDNVIKELSEAVNRWHPKIISFADDAFDMDKKWIEEFAVKYKEEIGLPFTSFAHPKFVDRKLTNLLKKAGLLGFELGVQSLNEKTKGRILNRYETNEVVIKAMNIIKEIGVELYTDHIVGLPYQTEEDLKRAVHIYNKIKPDKIVDFGLEYFPKSEIIEDGLEAKLITKNDVANIEEGYQTGFLLGGNKKNECMFKRYRAIFGLLPYVSYKKGEKLIESAYNNDAFPVLRTEFKNSMLSLLRDKDSKTKVFIDQYSEFLWRFITGKKQ